MDEVNALELEVALRNIPSLIIINEDNLAYNDINSLGGIFPLLLFVLEEYLLKNNINDLEPFDELLDRYTKTPVINKFIVENVDNNIVYNDVTYIGLYEAINNITIPEDIDKNTFKLYPVRTLVKAVWE